MAITKRSKLWPTTPREAYDLAAAIARDTANQQQRRVGRTAWNEDDANLCAETQGEMMACFGVLNPCQWLPDGYTWEKQDDGNWWPVATYRRSPDGNWWPTRQKQRLAQLTATGAQ